MIREGIEQGAVGFSTGLFYFPNSYADTRELIELCKAIREAGGVYITHLRRTFPERGHRAGRVAEALEIGRRSGVPVHFFHYQTSAVKARLTYWVQVVGSNLTAGWLAQLASTLPGKPLVHLAAANVWKRDFTPAHEPVERWVDVPEDPGLGVDADGETIEAFRRVHAPGRARCISTVSYPNGRLWSFAAG